MRGKTVYKTLAVSLILCLVVTLFSACDKKKMLAYYTEKENYLDAAGTVTFINYDEDSAA